MPTPTIRWSVNANGDWATAANWNLGRVPDAADDVFINTAHRDTVIHGAGADTVHTLTVRNDDFFVSGGSLTITSTSRFANLLVVSGAGTLELDGDATVARFTQFASTVSGSGTLTVTGFASLSSDILMTGPGTTVLRGASTFFGLSFCLDGGRILENKGAFTFSGERIKLGSNPFGSSLGGGTLKNDAGGSFDISDGSQIEAFSGANSFVNSGLVIKSGGAGTGNIRVKITDNGTIEAASGTLAFAKRITGGGTMAVSDGATLRVRASAAATLTMTFDGGDATLALGAPALFAATISGFAPTDTIDLLKTAATAATLGAGDTLAVTNGAATVATLQLAGDYTAATFNVASDGKGGTNITVTMPGPAHVANHPFIAAMAGLGGGAGGPAPAWTEARGDAWRPTLWAPRLAHVA